MNLVILNEVKDLLSSTAAIMAERKQVLRVAQDDKGEGW